MTTTTTTTTKHHINVRTWVQILLCVENADLHELQKVNITEKKCKHRVK